MTDIGTGQDSGQGPDQGQQQIDNNQQQVQSQGNGINPAWNELLGVVPSQLHSQVMPHLQKWDQNFQTKVNEVHSQYDGWKPIIDGGVTPQDADFALGLMNAISTNPQEVLSALQEWIENEGGEGDPNQQYDEQGQYNQSELPEGMPDISQHPAYLELQSAVQDMAQILLGQREEEQSQQEEAKLDEELNAAKEKYGEYDERYVLGLVLNDPEMTVEKAVEEYQELTNKILGNQRRPGPPILGSGGNSPNTRVDPRQMSSKDTRSYVANILAQAAGQQ